MHGAQELEASEEVEAVGNTAVTVVAAEDSQVVVREETVITAAAEVVPTIRASIKTIRLERTKATEK